MEKHKIFTRNFVYVAIVNFCVSMTYYILFVISTHYAMDRFETSASIGGFAAGLLLIGCVCGRMVAGKIVANLGFKKILITGLVVYILSIALYLATDNLQFFMLIRFISGLGIGCIGTVTNVIIVHIIPKELRGRGISYYSLSAVIAMAIGPFLGIYMMQHVDFMVIFLFCLAIEILSFAFAIFVAYPEIEKPAKTKRVFHLSDYISYTVVPISLVILFIIAGYGTLQAFLPIFAKEINLAKTAAMFFLVYAVAAFISRPFTGRIFDEKGANLIVYPSLISTIIGFAILWQTQSSAAMLVSAFFLGLGIANFQTTIQAICVKMSKGVAIPQAISTYFIFMDLGVGLGPYLYGFLAPLGYANMFAVAGFITLLSIPAYHFVYGKRAHS